MRVASPPASIRWLTAIALAASVLLGACFGDDASRGASTFEPAATSTSAPVSLSTATAEVVRGSTPTAHDLPLTTPPATASAAAPPATPTTTSTSTPAPSGTPATTLGVQTIVVQPDTAGAVSLGGRIQIAGTGWTVRFAEVVEDSRCPVDVQCVWAGQVVVRLTGQHSDGRTAMQTLTLGPDGRGLGALGDLRVETLGIEPSRLAGTPAPGNYVLRLRASLSTPAPTAGLSGVRGHVTIGPMCPVMRADQPCPDRPHEASMTVRTASGAFVARVQSGPDGAYSLALAPGKYILEPQSPTAVRLPFAGPEPFEVTGSSWTTLDIAFDSGIR